MFFYSKNILKSDIFYIVYTKPVMMHLEEKETPQRQCITT
jgi:hypothetical protein